MFLFVLSLYNYYISKIVAVTCRYIFCLIHLRIYYSHSFVTTLHYALFSIYNHALLFLCVFLASLNVSDGNCSQNNGGCHHKCNYNGRLSYCSCSYGYVIDNQNNGTCLGMPDENVLRTLN